MASVQLRANKGSKSYNKQKNHPYEKKHRMPPFTSPSIFIDVTLSCFTNPPHEEQKNGAQLTEYMGTINKCKSTSVLLDLLKAATTTAAKISASTAESSTCSTAKVSTTVPAESSTCSAAKISTAFIPLLFAFMFP